MSRLNLGTASGLIQRERRLPCVTTFLQARGQFGGIQDVSAALAGAIATSVAASMEGSSDEAVFTNVLLALVAAALLAAVSFVIIGRFRLGRIRRCCRGQCSAGRARPNCGWRIADIIKFMDKLSYFYYVSSSLAF